MRLYWPHNSKDYNFGSGPSFPRWSVVKFCPDISSEEELCVIMPCGWDVLEVTNVMYWHGHSHSKYWAVWECLWGRPVLQRYGQSGSDIKRVSENKLLLCLAKKPLRVCVIFPGFIYRRFFISQIMCCSQMSSDICGKKRNVFRFQSCDLAMKWQWVGEGSWVLLFSWTLLLCRRAAEGCLGVGIQALSFSY